ncbi:hypothetical protein CEE44_02925 [Candidatus Woesearchaeota archaeon B3_Woes]|nr:MAG: hypothetical protein CEE44_02925 [Candidatus Woesearchaeota archaeon B3_Woes]
MENFMILSKFAHVIDPNNQDFIRLFWSLYDKLHIHNYFLSQLDNYFEIVKKEFNEWDRKGSLSNKNNIILLAYFESLLNNVYSIMENVAKITVPFFLPKYNLKRGFRKQRNWFKKNSNLPVCKEYSDYLIKNLDWYDKLNTIRSEPTHFLSGLITFDKDENGIYIPKYFNIIKSDRNKKVFKTDKINIDLDFAHELGNNISEFLEFYGKHFISTLDSNEQTKISTVLLNENTGEASIKQVSVKLKDLISGKVKLKGINR